MPDHDEDDPYEWDRHFAGLQRAIQERQKELHDVADLLADAAASARRTSSIARVVIVVLGAAAATNGAATQVVGNDTAVIVIYTLIGLIIAAVGGLEAAFKMGERAVGLVVLAANCQSTVREIDSRWQISVGGADGRERSAAARDLLGLQDERLKDVQDQAARLGVNIAQEVRELSVGSRPYAA